MTLQEKYSTQNLLPDFHDFFIFRQVALNTDVF